MSEPRSQQEKEPSEIQEDLDELYPNVVKNKLESVKRILDKNPHCVHRLYCGETLLDYPCRYGGFEMAKLLIEKGIQVNNCNKIGSPPIVLAITYNNFDIVRLLIENKAKLEGIVVQDNLTMLDLTVLHGRYEMAEHVYNLVFDKTLKTPDQYEIIARKYFLKYVNYSLFIEGLKTGKTAEKVGDYLTRPVTPEEEDYEEETCCFCFPLSWFVYKPKYGRKAKVEKPSSTRSEKESNRDVGTGRNMINSKQEI